MEGEENNLVFVLIIEACYYRDFKFDLYLFSFHFITIIIYAADEVVSLAVPERLLCLVLNLQILFGKFFFLLFFMILHFPNNFTAFL